MKIFTRQAFVYAGFAGLLSACVVPAGRAQTSGSLSTQITSATNYSTAPWVISAGTGKYPDGGGTATLNEPVNTIVGTAVTSTTLNVNVSPTLSNIICNSPFSYTFAAGNGTSIIASTAGLTINTLPAPTTVPTGLLAPTVISSPISGGGTAGLTTTGFGSVRLNAANTYTGGTHFNGGITYISVNATVGDTVLGATGAGNGLSFNGGALSNGIPGGWTTSRSIYLDTGGGTIYANNEYGSAGVTLNGVVSGPGAFTANGGTGPYPAIITLAAANTYTGATTATSSSSVLTLSGNGSIAASSGYDFSGAVNLDSSTTNINNRLSDTAAITARGINLTLTGNASAATAETTGVVTLTGGLTTLTVTPGSGQAASLNLASLTRSNNSLLFVRGTGLGGASGANVATVTAGGMAASLVGGGGSAGSANISIVPWAIGNTGSSTSFTAAGTVGSSLVTYDSTNGFRPLATTEYAAAFGGNPTNNVRLTATTAGASGATANAVVFAPAAAATLSGGTVNVTSGAVLYSPTADAAGTISAALNFGTAEGVITNTSSLTLSGPISGSGGLTLGSPSGNNVQANTVTLTGTSSYTGNTTITSGAVLFSGTVAANGTNSAFGANGDIVLNAGVNATLLEATAAATLNRNLVSVGTGNNSFGPNLNSNFALVMNGNVSLQNSLSVAGVNASNPVTFNGTISGPGAMNPIGYVIFNGTNTYTGGTSIGGSSSTIVAGTDTAFGTGPIYTNLGAIAGVGTAARTLANSVVFNGGVTFTGNAPLTFTGSVNLDGANTITVGNPSVTFSGVVSNGALTKSGNNGGMLSLSSPTGNTYTGGTFVGPTDGALIVNNTSGSGTGSGTVSIAGNTTTSYSTLAGSFTISGATSVTGRLSPGNSGTTAANAGVGAIGTANFGSTLTLSSGPFTGSLYLEVAGPNSFDKINVAGVLTLKGTVYIATTGGYTIQAGDTFKFATWGSINSGTVTFETTGATLAPGVTLDTSAFTTTGIVTAVPEPRTWALLLLSILGLIAQRRAIRRFS